MRLFLRKRRRDTQISNDSEDDSELGALTDPELHTQSEAHAMSSGLSRGRLLALGVDGAVT